MKKIVWAALPLLVVVHGSKCPCANEALCQPVDSKGPVAEKEIFGFWGGGDGVPSDSQLEKLTTIAWAENGPKELLCKAHEKNVRLIAGTGIFERVPLTGNLTVREEWAHGMLHAVQKRSFDGLVFDFEEPLEAGSDEARWYVEIINRTREVFHEANPAYQISTCVAWSPDSIDGRAYDYFGLSQASDVLYVMDYDTRSQIFDACIAAANAPFFGTKKGLESFLNLGVKADKLILGVPWYGYRYPCLPGTPPESRFCPIKPVPFRGVDCSDAVGKELDYRLILEKLDKFTTTGQLWDENQFAPFFNALEDGVVFQYWFDNAKSLRRKYALAKSLGLRGVGPYTIYGTADEDVWKAFDEFLLDESFSMLQE